MFTADYRRKIGFKATCSVFSHPQAPNEKFVELVFDLDNKGRREYHCYTLAYELQAIVPRSVDTPPFVRRSGNVVPTEAGYYYVRAGVTQQISARLWIPGDIRFIRVKACALFDRQRREISPERDLLEQVYKSEDWIALDRVFPV